MQQICAPDEMYGLAEVFAAARAKLPDEFVRIFGRNMAGKRHTVDQQPKFPFLETTGG